MRGSRGRRGGGGREDAVVMFYVQEGARGVEG